MPIYISSWILFTVDDNIAMLPLPLLMAGEFIDDNTICFLALHFYNFLGLYFLPLSFDVFYIHLFLLLINFE